MPLFWLVIPLFLDTAPEVRDADGEGKKRLS
jgi:hypothetical protein